MDKFGLIQDALIKHDPLSLRDKEGYEVEAMLLHRRLPFKTLCEAQRVVRDVLDDSLNPPRRLNYEAVAQELFETFGEKK